MKKLLWLILGVSPMLGLSQSYYEFPSDSTTWSHSWYSGIVTTTTRSCTDVAHHGIFGDTTIQGELYFKLYGYWGGASTNNPGFDLQSASFKGGLRSDSLRRVYYFEANDTIEHLMMDFGLSVGDTFCYDNKTPPCHVVSSIDSQLINDNQYRRATSFYGYTWWVEGIGHWFGGFFGEAAWSPPMYWEFSCHANKGVQLIGVAGDCSCEPGEVVGNDTWNIVSISNRSSEEYFHSLFPNPTSGQITLTFAWTAKTIRLLVLDIAGRRLTETYYTNSDQIALDVSNLKAGAYLFRVETDYGAFVKKLVVK